MAVRCKPKPALEHAEVKPGFQLRFGVNNNTYFIRPLVAGKVQIVGEPIQQGATQQLWQVVITHASDGKLLARGQVRLQNVALPDTPPANQSLPGFSIDLWHGIVAPAGMDPALVNRINAVFNQILKTPAVSAAISQSQAA